MNKNRILVVDDEEKIRTIIRKYAEFEGYQVTEAASGMEAVSLCRKPVSYTHLTLPTT